MQNQSRIRRPILRMNPPQPLRQIRIQPSHKRNPRRPRQPSRPNPRNRNAKHQSKRRHNPSHANPPSHMPNSLHNPLQNADLVLTNRNQKRQSRQNIKNARQNPAPSHRPRQILLRLANLIAHHRSQFQPHQPKTNHPKRIQNKSRISRNPKIRSSNRGSKPQPHHNPKPDQNRRRNPSPDPAKIIDPLPHAQPANIQPHQQHEQQKRSANGKKLVVRQRLVPQAPKQKPKRPRNKASR